MEPSFPYPLIKREKEVGLLCPFPYNFVLIFITTAVKHGSILTALPMAVQGAVRGLALHF